MAATLMMGVKYRQAECTWIFDSFRRRYEKSNAQLVSRRALELRGASRNHTRQVPATATAFISKTLSVHLGLEENNGNGTPNWSAQLDLVEEQEPGLQVGRITLRPAHQQSQWLTSTCSEDSESESSDSDEINIVVCVVDKNGVEAFETSAEESWRVSQIGQPAYRDPEVKVFTFGLPGTEIMRNHQLYLPNDKLRIKAKITLCDKKSDGPAPSPLSVVSTSSTSRLAKLSKDMLEIKNSGLQNDFEIICGGTTFPVHQAILAARSQYFATMLGTDMKEKNERKLIDDECDPQTIKILLEYIYSSNIEIEKLGSELISSLTKAADKYQLEELKDICFTHMVKSLSLETAGNVAVTAYLYSAPQNVRETVFQFCAKNWQTLASSSEFQAINAAWPKAFHKP